MATIKTVVLAASTFTALALGGCSSGGGGFLGFGDSSSSITTASLPEAMKVDPACSGLTAQIASLRQDGVADKIEKAAAKKYKMTAADLTKADQLTKASADYQSKCGTGPKAVVAQAPVVAPVTTNIGSAVAAATSAAPAAAAVTKATAAAKTAVAPQ
jgi:hypothetical protein